MLGSNVSYKLGYFSISRLKFLTSFLRQRLHGTRSVWNWHGNGTDKPCVYTGPDGSGTDRIGYLVPNGSTFEGDPYGTVPF